MITGLVIGIGIGMVLMYLLSLLKTAFGIITIDQTDLIKDMYKIEIEDLDALEKKKRVVLKVKNINTQN